MTKIEEKTMKALSDKLQGRLDALFVSALFAFSRLFGGEPTGDCPDEGTEMGPI